MNLGRGLRATSSRWLVESLHRRIPGGKPWSARAPRILSTKPWWKAFTRWRFLRQGKIFRNQKGEAGRPSGRPPHRCDESSTGYSSAGCSPAVEYPTYGLDKTERNWERVNWSGPCGGGKLKAEGSLVLFQARPSSVVPGPVTKSVMTPGLGDVWRLGRSRLGEYSLCTARAVAPWLTSREECGHGAKAKEC
jgi:hypothetical protein